jgi:hypothetical protein
MHDVLSRSAEQPTARVHALGAWELPSGNRPSLPT